MSGGRCPLSRAVHAGLSAIVSQLKLTTAHASASHSAQRAP